MAGDWIKWTVGLGKKPEVMVIASAIGRGRLETAGILMEVWEWADANVTIDDSVSGFDPDTCPGSVRLGDQSRKLFDAIAGVPGFADAMSAVGWLCIRNGSLTFPNFARHNGKSAKARSLDSARKRAGREKTSAKRPDFVRKMSGSQPDKTRTRGEESREEKREEVRPPNPHGGNAVATTEPPPPAATKPKKPPKPKAEPKPRERNTLFDAIADVCGLDPSMHGSLIGGVAVDLNKADVPYTVDDVREFAKRFWELCSWAKKDGRTRPTGPELRKYISQIRAAPATPDVPLSANHRLPFPTTGEARAASILNTINTVRNSDQ